ncbi:MAG: hypothetical protein ACI84R_003245 [Candidatus Azotimanducaceae bacterium]|jgi:hypothetical protein
MAAVVAVLPNLPNLNHRIILMKILPFLAATAITVTPVLAEENRQLDAHEHGVGQLDIAFDGKQIAMELHAPGADIVGFEYAAESAQDRATVDAAVATLAGPLGLFVLPDAAGCSVVQAAAGLESEEEHHEHADDHDDDHADEKHADDDHADDEHAHDDHEEDEHEDHASEAGHTEFHAEYLLTCADPSAITDINFAYFESFPNALEVEVQVITDAGATSFEVERDTPILDLRGMF